MSISTLIVIWNNIKARNHVRRPKSRLPAWIDRERTSKKLLGQAKGTMDCGHHCMPTTLMEDMEKNGSIFWYYPTFVDAKGLHYKMKWNAFSLTTLHYNWRCRISLTWCSARRERSWLRAAANDVEHNCTVSFIQLHLQASHYNDSPFTYLTLKQYERSSARRRPVCLRPSATTSEQLWRLWHAQNRRRHSSRTRSRPPTYSYAPDRKCIFQTVSKLWPLGCSFPFPLPTCYTYRSSQAKQNSHIVQVTISNQVKTKSTASNEDWMNALHHHPRINSTKSPMASTTIGKLETA